MRNPIFSEGWSKRHREKLPRSLPHLVPFFTMLLLFFRSLSLSLSQPNVPRRLNSCPLRPVSAVDRVFCNVPAGCCCRCFALGIFSSRFFLPWQRVSLPVPRTGVKHGPAVPHEGDQDRRGVPWLFDFSACCDFFRAVRFCPGSRLPRPPGERHLA